MPAIPSDIFTFWEESLLALSRYCVHYGLDDDDERAIKHYLEICAQFGRNPLKELTSLIKAQGQINSDVKPELHAMTIPKPQWQWICYDETEVERKVRRSEVSDLADQLRTHAEIEVRRKTGNEVSGRYRLTRCLEAKAVSLETVPELNLMKWLWYRLRGIRRFKVMVYSKWEVIELSDFTVVAFTAKQAFNLAREQTSPKALEPNGQHKLIDVSLKSEETDIIVGELSPDGCA